MAIGQESSSRKRCLVCQEPLLKAREHYCSRLCCAAHAAFIDLYEFHATVLDWRRYNRNTSEPSQHYFEHRVREAVRHLSESGDLLAEVLIEIAGLQDEVNEHGMQQR